MAASRTYDVIVFGATGFTGEKVAAELVKDSQGRKLAVAGRSLSKLQLIVKTLGTGVQV
jgi:short subunit dehydrogenase-like uncharacterized protein